MMPSLFAPKPTVVDPTKQPEKVRIRTEFRAGKRVRVVVVTRNVVIRPDEPSALADLPTELAALRLIAQR